MTAGAGTRETKEGALKYQYLLLARYALANLVAIGLLAAAYLHGWLDPVLTADLIELPLIIVGVFAYGFVACTAHIWQISREINDVNAGRPETDSRAGAYLEAVRNGGGDSRSLLTDMFRLKLTNRIALTRQIANSLVFLGLIGTVIGFIIALSGIDPAAATDVAKVAPMVSALIKGMAVALNTTLVGAVCYVWLIVNHRMLASGTLNLLTATIELAQHDRAA